MLTLDHRVLSISWATHPWPSTSSLMRCRLTCGSFASTAIPRGANAAIDDQVAELLVIKAERFLDLVKIEGVNEPILGVAGTYGDELRDDKLGNDHRTSSAGSSANFVSMIPL